MSPEESHATFVELYRAHPPRTLSELIDQLHASGHDPLSIGAAEDPDFPKMEGNTVLRQRPGGEWETAVLGRGSERLQQHFETEADAVASLAQPYLEPPAETVEIDEDEVRRIGKQMRHEDVSWWNRLFG